MSQERSRSFTKLPGGSRKLQAKDYRFHNLPWHSLIPLLIMVHLLCNLWVCGSCFGLIPAWLLPRASQEGLSGCRRGRGLQVGIGTPVEGSSSPPTSRSPRPAPGLLSYWASLPCCPRQTASISGGGVKELVVLEQRKPFSVLSCQITQYHFHTLPPRN